jgi:hypothetical protein
MPSLFPQSKPSKQKYTLRESGIKKTCEICGTVFRVPAWKINARYCSATCRQSGNSRSPARKAYNDQIRGSGVGYVKEGGVHQHRLVAELKLGRPLRKDEVVHHRDGNQQNNTPENLAIITRQAHALIHLYGACEGR